MYEFFREHGFKTPQSELVNPYCYAHQTGNQTLWEYVGSFPERFRSLNLAMNAQTSATNWTVGLFPFKSVLSRYETNEKTVLAIDIGGGGGHITKQIRELTDGIPGRYILQERAELLKTADHSESGIEVMEYDFFTPQPIQGKA
jgi:hypothetical protein